MRIHFRPRRFIEGEPTLQSFIALMAPQSDLSEVVSTLGENHY